MAIKIPDKYKIWIEVRKKFKLSHRHIQMARELGMNPKKFGSLANHKQEPWKAPLAQFIVECYLKRFSKEPSNIVSIEQTVKNKRMKKEAKNKLKESRGE